MKKLLSFSSFILLAAGALMAQAPNRLSYQAVVRNSSGVILASGTNVGMRFTIHDGSSGGTIIYQETTTQTITNNFGQIAYFIGNGAVQQGAFPTATQWASGSKFLQIEVDPSGGSSYTDLGTVQLMSVPYAQYANSAGTANSFSGNINPSQINQNGASNGQVLQWNGSNWAPATVSGGGGGGDITDVLAGSGMTGGGTSGSVTLNADNANNIWNANKLQGKDVSTSAPGSGQVLKYNGTNWAPAADDNTAYSAGTGLSLSGTTFNSVWTQSGNNIYNNNSGNLGIGTTSPQEKFHLKGTGGSLGRIEFGSSSWLSIYRRNAYIGYMGVYNDTNAIDFGTSGSGQNLNLVTGAAPRLTINTSGFVGIGNTNPTYLLDINGTGSSNVARMKTTTGNMALMIDANTSGFGEIQFYEAGTFKGEIYHSPNDYISVWQNSADRLVVRNSMVGVNNNNPAYPLDVNGTTNVVGSHYVSTAVGIANTAPARKLHITVGSAQEGLRIATSTNASKGFELLANDGGGSNNAYIWNWEAASMYFGTGNTFRMTIDKDGNFQLGTSTASTHKMWVYDNTSGSSGHYGVYSEMANATQGGFQSAVYGINRGTAGNGVGVAGVHAASGFGLYGSAGTGGYAVYASGASSTDYAFYGIGKGSVSGSFSKASGTFKIDHPQDPENKWLYHSFVESPDMMNIYNGNITTDAEGNAIVKMPDYFEALNMDFRYQLTVMGTFAQAIVAEKMENNQFKIKTDKPNVEVSWQVTGVRHDNWANANRVVPEVQKVGEELGKYQNPEVFGQPNSKRYVPAQAAAGLKLPPANETQNTSNNGKPGEISPTK